MTVKALVITGYGINADAELAESFSVSGADAERVHVAELAKNPKSIAKYSLVGFPGGFSFGDHLGSGKVIANLFRGTFKSELESFIGSGGLVIGICNGFQTLVKMGIIPNTEGKWEQEATIVHNDSGRFTDEWIRVKTEKDSVCVWTQGFDEIDLPIRHGEGRFVARDPSTLGKLEAGKLVALRYVGKNPNGSVNDIAGISDSTGRVLGLMPHPEAYLTRENHPDRRRRPEGPLGLDIIAKGVEYARRNSR